MITGFTLKGDIGSSQKGDRTVSRAIPRSVGYVICSKLSLRVYDSNGILRKSE